MTNGTTIEMRGTGYVKLYRAMKEWEWFHDLPVRVLFHYLLIEVNYLPGRFEGRDIAPGQLPTSTSKLAQGSGLSRQSVRTALDKLKSTGEITIEATHDFSVITIVNWDKYQSDAKKTTRRATREATTEQHVGNTSATTIEEGKKGIREEDSAARKILFVNSGYCDLEAAKAALPELVAKGIDLEAYRDRIRDWSDTKDERRTDRGWLATYKSWVAGDERKGSVLKLKTEGWNPRL